MVVRQFGSDYLLRFDKGELLVETLLKFIKDRGIHPAWVNGLGGALWAEVGFYDLDKKQYSFQKIEKNLEIANLTGNIAWVNNAPVAHLHIVVSDDHFQAYGGHLKELAVAGTCEVRLKTFNEAITRKHSEEIGLDLLDL